MNQQEVYQSIQKYQPNLCQISVLRDGNELCSAEWNGYQKTDCVHIASATKSVMALLIGIAIDHKMIGSVNDKVLSYFPEYAVKRGERTILDVTIRHLLTMRAPYKGFGDPWTKVCSGEDWTKASLDFLGGKRGITDAFDYRTVCLHILSGILFKATGMKTVDFANESLFRPLGIAAHESCYAGTAQAHKQFIMDKAPRAPVWLADLQGLAAPGYGLCLSAADLARLGQLCLQNGTWNGRQIVSPDWLREMLSPRRIEGGPFGGKSYGYLWWIVHPERNVYAAIGDSGNAIYVDPNERIVAAVSSCFRPAVRDRIAWIEGTLLPAVPALILQPESGVIVWPGIKKGRPPLKRQPPFVIFSLNRRTAGWRDSDRRYPAAGRRWSCPCFPGALPAEWQPIWQRRKKCRPIRLLSCQSVCRRRRHPHFLQE